MIVTKLSHSRRVHRKIYLLAASPTNPRLQRWVNPLWLRMAGGCHLTRNGVDLLREAGFTLGELEPVGPQRFTLLPNTVGHASRP